MNIKNSPLFIIDVQNGFVRPASAHVIPQIRTLIDAWQRAGGETLFTRYVNYPGSPYEKLIGWTKMQKGAPDTELVADLAEVAENGIVIEKPVYTALTDEVKQLITEQQWRDIYICGIATESCVLKTAIDAFESGLTPWVIEDATASHAGEEAHEAGMLAMKRNIGRGQFVTMQSVLEKLSV